jgi:hypothetical protein
MRYQNSQADSELRGVRTVFTERGISRFALVMLPISLDEIPHAGEETVVRQQFSF